MKDKIAAKILNRLSLPKSLLIIPDGNRRWAKSHHLSAWEGHEAGGEKLLRMLTVFKDLNIDVIGIWAFSEDNWKRNKQEVDKLMPIIQNLIDNSLDIMIKNNIKLLVVGKRERLQKEYPNLFKALQNAERKTAQNSKKIFAIFIDYGERWQLEEFARVRCQNSKLPTYKILSKINKGLPMFDMVIRTSGELRLSGFGPLAGLAELIPIQKKLPEVSTKDIVLAFKEYSGRKRRLGN